MSRVGQAISWIRTQPDRPFVIVFAHLCVVGLYVTGNAVSTSPFSDDRAKTLITSDAMPTIHGLAAVVLVVAILLHHYRGAAAGVSLVVWGATTATLFYASHQRVPPGAYWAASLSLVITLAAFLMLVRWGVDGDERGAI